MGQSKWSEVYLRRPNLGSRFFVQSLFQKFYAPWRPVYSVPDVYEMLSTILQSFCFSICPLIHLSIHPTICPYFLLFIHLPVHLFIYFWQHWGLNSESHIC
jgi:hypothetical protein